MTEHKLFTIYIRYHQVKKITNMHVHAHSYKHTNIQTLYAPILIHTHLHTQVDRNVSLLAHFALNDPGP